MEKPDVAALLAQLQAMGSDKNRAGMARFGINVRNAYGVSVTELRKLARAHRKDHTLAGALWATGVHEARMLAAFVEDPARVTPGQMERWARDFDSWDLTDGCATALFDRTPHAYEMARRWSGRDEEYVRRAAFALMAGLAVHDKGAPDEDFLAFLPLIKEAATDERNFVKKAVNWALRQIGKRNARLNRAAVRTAREMARTGDRTARWIATDALRELTSEAKQARLRGMRGGGGRTA